MTRKTKIVDRVNKLKCKRKGNLFINKLEELPTYISF